MKLINLTGRTPKCDACDNQATTALKFNTDGDAIYMCNDHFKALKIELDKFTRINSTESAQA